MSNLSLCPWWNQRPVLNYRAHFLIHNPAWNKEWLLCFSNAFFKKKNTLDGII